MNNIENKEHYGNIIMGQSRHQFVYGYNGQERTDFLRELALKYPITLDESKPMGIYLEEIGIPKETKSNEDLDIIALATLSREYCHFSIASGIIDTTLEQIGEHPLNSRVDKLLSIVNRGLLNKSHTPISDLKELGNILNEVKQAYQYAYEQYIESGTLRNFVDDLPISFMWLEKFIEYYKEMLNNKSYFGILIDHQKSISINSQQAINGLLGSRINSDLSIKVACEPNGWETYCNLNGVFVENVHDYGLVEIDDSHKEYMKKLTGGYKWS